MPPQGKASNPTPAVGGHTRPRPAYRVVGRAGAISFGCRRGGSARRGECGLRCWGRRSVSVFASSTPAPRGRTGLGERPLTRPRLSDPGGLQAVTEGRVSAARRGARGRAVVVYAGGVRGEGPESPLYLEAGAPSRALSALPIFS